MNSSALTTLRRLSGPNRSAFASLAWLLLLLPGVFPSALQAAVAPTNDTCVGALAIPSIGPFPFYCPVQNITNATAAGENFVTNGLCSAPVSRGTWYKFRPVIGGLYTLTTCAPGTTVEDTVMAIYRSSGGCGGTLTAVDCDDDALGACNLLSTLTVPLLADTDYYVVVWLYDVVAPDAGKTSLQMVVTREIPPPNDTCATALPVFLNTPVFGSTVLANNNYQLSGSAMFTGIGHKAAPGVGRDVVYAFMVPADGDYSFKVSSYKDEDGFDLMIYVGGYTGGTGTQMVSSAIAAANRNHVSTSEELMCIGLTNNQLVYIYVDDTNFNSGSPFILEVTRCLRETEPNNTPATASHFSAGVEGTISSIADYDYYSMGTFPEGWRLFAMAIGDAANTPPDFQIRVTTVRDTLEYDDNDNDPRFGETSPNIAGTPLPAEPTFLSVHGASQLEPYRLYAVVQPPLSAATPEIEPNGTLPTANSSPGNYYYGTLAGPSPSLDEDLYRFTALDGDLVFVSLDGDPTRDGTPLNARLELLDEFGNSLVLVDDGRSTSDISRTTNNLYAGNPDSPGEALIYRCSEGTYYVRVSIGNNALGIPQPGLAGNGDYLLSISRNCLAGSSGVNTPPTFTGVSATSPILEGGSTTLNGSVFDPDLGDSISVVIDWGDGSNIVLNFDTPGLNPFLLNHTYLDDAPSGTSSDLYTITLTATDSHGASGMTTSSVRVSNAPPSLLHVTVTSPVYANSNAVVTGDIADIGILDTFTVAVNWGDGSPVEQLSYPAGASSFTAAHAYATGNTTYPIQVTLTDDDLGAASATVPLLVKLYPEAGRFVGLSSLPNGHILLNLQATPLAAYRVFASDDLVSWSELGSSIADAAGTLTFEDTSPAPASRFYRALSVP